MQYNEIVNLLRDGELVQASTTNRAPQQLAENVAYLKAILDAAMTGSAVFARERAVETDVQVGQAVYYNAANARFERALGGVEADAVTGYLKMTAASQVWGIVYSKASATVADILLSGTAAVDLSQAVTGTPEASALYYLSNVSPGVLERQLPPVGVTVLQVTAEESDGTYTVLVRPQFMDLLTAHRHYKFSLVCRPAGDTVIPAYGERHVITSADPTQEGWLPANHAVFAGRAPAGAVFGYNMSVSPLWDLWPPLPLEGAYLELDRGEMENLMGTGVPLGPDKLCVIDRNGIWWMSDCWGDVPWPTDWAGIESVSESLSVTECPRNLYMTLTLWFNKPVFQNTGTCVLSLRTAADSGLLLTCTDSGDAATTGHLTLDLDLDLTVDAGDAEPGHLVFKRLSDKKYYRGPMVESLKAGSSNVHLTSDAAAGEGGKLFGNLSLLVEPDIEGYELSIDTVRLDNCTEEFYEDTIALGFPAGRNANFRGRVTIPANAVIPAGTKLKLRFTVLSRDGTTLPDSIFTLSYRRLPRPAELLTPASLPTADTALADLPETSVTFSAANEYFEMESEEFVIAAGDLVQFTLGRQGYTDAYPGDLHLLRQRGVLVLGS